LLGAAVLCCGCCPVLAVTPMVSLGDSHALALRTDGTVLAWGSDIYGQLGLGRTLVVTTPVRVTGLPNVRSVASGASHSLAVRQDGTVWAWGSNDAGQLGDGTSTDRSNPVQVQGVSSAVMACAGGLHSAALQQDGTVLAWGNNWFGQLGNGSTGWSSAPTKVAGLSGATTIACGTEQTFALLQDGSVRAWGANSSGQLGDGTTTDRWLPVLVSGLGNVVAIQSSVALQRDGTVWEWGYSEQGPIKLPVRLSTISDAVAIGVVHGGGYGTRLEAIKSDGTTWWHWTKGTAPELQVPVGSLKATASSPEFTLLLKADGSVASAGVVGSGSGWVPDFQPVPALTHVVAVATGAAHALALDANGGVWAWGDDGRGQLGGGGTLTAAVPNAVPGLSNIVQVSAGVGGSSMALDQSGNVWVWGYNYHGRLGDGTWTNRSAPVRLPGVSDVRALATSPGATSMALKRDGTVWAWGINTDGQLGEGIGAPTSSVPVKIAGLANIMAIAAASHLLAVNQDGTVWTWGKNSNGELGLDTTTPSAVPRQVPGLTGVQSVAAGGAADAAHSFAVKSDGTVVAWGSGALGDGPWKTGQRTPIPVPGLTDVTEISTSSWHTLVRRTDGSVWGWGTPWYSGLGSELGSSSRSWTPVPVSSPGPVQGLGAAESRSALVGTNGLLYMGGANALGQLGDGTFAEHRDFVLALNPAASGFLNLANAGTTTIAPALQTPFFVSSSGGITSTSASVATSAKFNPADTGKSGAVYVTASVPAGSSLAQSARPASEALGARPNKLAGTTPPGGFTLLQLTPSGWQTVVNGQLIPYTSGVLGDQLAAQTILNNTDTSNLKGAEFCVGYGTTAADMVANGNIRAVATIPGATTTASCVVGGSISVPLGVAPGWNLLGNPVNQSIAVATQFGDAVKVNSVWKWDSTAAKWRFYTPGMSAAELQRYAASQGFGVLNEIQAGDGYWVNAKTQADLGTVTGAAINLRQSSLSTGWNLVATAGNVTPQDFNLSLSTTPPTAGQVPVNLTSLWTWDSAQSRWYFYAPSLEETALTSHIQDQGYRHFGKTGKTVGDGAGFWVRRP
jgi:alpha-tubulin suppressor-like RCC1 family protein